MMSLLRQKDEEEKKKKEKRGEEDEEKARLGSDGSCHDHHSHAHGLP